MNDYEIGHRVVVSPFNKAGTVRCRSVNASGKVLYGVVYDDEERRVKGRRGAMDVYVEARHLSSLDSEITIS